MNLNPKIIISQDNEIIDELEIDLLFKRIAAKTERLENKSIKLLPQFWIGQFVFFDKEKEDSLLKNMRCAKQDNLQFQIVYDEYDKYEKKLITYGLANVELCTFPCGTVFNFKASHRIQLTD